MARVCDNCLTVHPSEVINCEDAKKIGKKNREEFNRRTAHHKEHCRACPDPAAHIRNLDRLDNPKQKEIPFG